MIDEQYKKVTITEIQHLPEHEEREVTVEFRSAKRELVKLDDRPCLICETKEKRECHHIFQRAFWNGFDLRKVAYYLFNHFDFHGEVKEDFKSEKELYDYLYSHYNGRWVKSDSGKEYPTCDDDAADMSLNMMVLCQEHHRGEGTSAHFSTFATFMAWMVHADGYEVSMDEDDYIRRKKEHRLD